MWTTHTCKADTILLAQVGLFFRWDVCLPVGLLIGVLGLGIWVVVRLRRWRVELLEDEGAPPEELTLEHFQALLDDGLLDPQEFERIKARLLATANDRDPEANHDNPSTHQPPDTSFRPE